MGFWNLIQWPELQGLDVGSLLAFGALCDFKLNLLTLFQGFEATHVDCGKVSEQVLTSVFRGNKTEAFRIVKPLDCTSCHKRGSFYKCIILTKPSEKIEFDPVHCWHKDRQSQAIFPKKDGFLRNAKNLMVVVQPGKNHGLHEQVKTRIINSGLALAHK